MRKIVFWVPDNLTIEMQSNIAAYDASKAADPANSLVIIDGHPAEYISQTTHVYANTKSFRVKGDSVLGLKFTCEYVPDNAADAQKSDEPKRAEDKDRKTARTESEAFEAARKDTLKRFKNLRMGEKDFEDAAVEALDGFLDAMRAVHGILNSDDE